jgi:hypothetical protein
MRDNFGLLRNYRKYVGEYDLRAKKAQVEPPFHPDEHSLAFGRSPAWY